jgi:hypothetical protein
VMKNSERVSWNKRHHLLSHLEPGRIRNTGRTASRYRNPSLRDLRRSHLYRCAHLRQLARPLTFRAPHAHLVRLRGLPLLYRNWPHLHSIEAASLVQPLIRTSSPTVTARQRPVQPLILISGST